MIDRDTVQRILDTAQVVEVIEDYVTLKKRGSNYLGLCPFHNEKTPSFMVSPAKGIFKCFGCGEAGSAVHFVMKHEHLEFPDALRYLAKKYHIEVVEKERSSDEIAIEKERESLLVATAFAQKYFTDLLHHHREGKAVGLSYFTERGFTLETIHKFQLGYSLEARDAFTREALNKGYKLDHLEKTGLTIVKEDYRFDRFSGRVLFPIHSLSGRIVAFGGRILKTDKTIAKYLNSPESQIYHKSDILFGIFYAKNAIVKLDKCYMVEGYTDMISLYQAGIENVVASSGTSLTVNQIRLVKRFTQNLTIIYDGDSAGIKASMRGIDLVLEEGMSVKVIPLPAGEDPDSFSKMLSKAELQDYIERNEENFITFKARLLLDDAKNDPIKRASLIGDIVRSISIIPDSILRAEYIKECSNILGTKEQALYDESNKIIQQKFESNRQKNFYDQQKPKTESTLLPSFITEVYSETEEKEIIFFLLNFGNQVFYTYENDTQDSVSVSVAEYIIADIRNDNMEFNNLIYKQIFEECQQLLLEENVVDEKSFIYHTDEKIKTLAADLLSEDYTPSKIWEKQGNFVETPEMTFKKDIPKALITFKLKIIQIAIDQNDKSIKELKPEEYDEKLIHLIQQKMVLNDVKKVLAKEAGERTIL